MIYHIYMWILNILLTIRSLILSLDIRSTLLIFFRSIWPIFVSWLPMWFTRRSFLLYFFPLHSWSIDHSSTSYLLWWGRNLRVILIIISLIIRLLIFRRPYLMSDIFLLWWSFTLSIRPINWHSLLVVLSLLFLISIILHIIILFMHFPNHLFNIWIIHRKLLGNFILSPNLFIDNSLMLWFIVCTLVSLMTISWCFHTSLYFTSSIVLLSCISSIIILISPKWARLSGSTMRPISFLRLQV